MVVAFRGEIMKIPVSFAELHNPLFLAGKNHKQKLYGSDLKLIFDDEADKLYVLYNNQIAIVPSTNCSSITPANPEIYFNMFQGLELTKQKSTNKNHAMKLDIRGAQVSDPTTTIQNPVGVK